jgi:hypothetical protein
MSKPPATAGCRALLGLPAQAAGPDNGSTSDSFRPGTRLSPGLGPIAEERFGAHDPGEW